MSLMRLWRHFAGHFLLWVTGFEIEGEKPKEQSYVLIAAPHTTNWDLPVMLAMSYLFDINLSYLAKHTIFKGPFAWWFKWLGGIPVDRRSNHNVVSQVADVFGENEDLILAISPEGTRKYTPYWRTGFYHIAREAGVPIAMGYIDYSRRRGGIGKAFMPSGDIKKDMDHLRAFYEPKKGKFPTQYRAPRLKIEDNIPNVQPKEEPVQDGVLRPAAQG